MKSQQTSIFTLSDYSFVRILFDQKRNTTANDHSIKVCLSDHSSMLMCKGNNCWVARVTDNGVAAGSPGKAAAWESRGRVRISHIIIYR